MKKACIILAMLALTAGAATAGSPAFGPRVGYTNDNDIDQLHFGGHVRLPDLTSNVRIVPSIELGVGDGTLLAANGDVIYEFTELATSQWSFYAGGGPTLSRFEKDGHDSTDFALSLVIGTTFDVAPAREFFGEIRIGLEDAPDMKFTVGLTFF